MPRGLVEKASAGAVSLNHNGDKGALLAMIHLQDADRGYSETVNFTNPGGKTTERHGAGLRLGSVNNDPLRAVIAVRNIGESATTVTATIPYSKQNGDTGTIALPQVSLAPGEIELLNTSDPQLRQNDFATAGLEIKYMGAPGSVIATASSVSQSGNHVFALPMKDPQGGLSSTGGYPWFINGTSSTVVYIKNTTDAPQQFHLSIIYPGGAWGSNLKTLAPGQTFELDVRKVRDSQVKGSEGNTMPRDVTAGHISWGVYGPVEKALIGRAQTIDLARGQSSTYECQCYCGVSFGEARLLPGSVSGSIGDTVQFQPEERITATFTIVESATPGNHAVTVTTDGGGGRTSNSVNFFVQAPTALQVLSANLSSGLPNGCTTSPPTIGTQLNIRYQVLDQGNQPIVATMPLREDLTMLTIIGVQNPNFDRFDVPVTPSGNTEASGAFTDNPVGACGAPELLPPAVEGSTATFRQRLFIRLGATVFDVRTNNFSFSFRRDCGRMTNGSDISVNNCP